MKAYTVLLFVFLMSPAHAQIRNEYSGMWYNPEQNGHGLILEVIYGRDWPFQGKNSVHGFWFAYDYDGNPLWLELQGEILEGDPSQVFLELYQYRGMRMREWNPNDVTQGYFGTGWLEFQDCNTLHFKASQQNTIPVVPAYNGTMVRLSHVSGLYCEDSTSDVAAMKLTGEWGWKLGNETYFTAIADIQQDGTFSDSRPSYDGYELVPFEPWNPKLEPKTFYDDCAYQGQIQVNDLGVAELILESVGAGDCSSDVPTHFTGLVYEHYSFCPYAHSEMECETYDWTIVFNCDDYDQPLCSEEDNEVIFWKE